MEADDTLYGCRATVGANATMRVRRTCFSSPNGGIVNGEARLRRRPGLDSVAMLPRDVRSRIGVAGVHGIARRSAGGVFRGAASVTWRSPATLNVVPINKGQLFLPATAALTLKLHCRHRETHGMFAGWSAEAAAAPALPQPARLTNLRFALQARSRTTDECNKRATP